MTVTLLSPNRWRQASLYGMFVLWAGLVFSSALVEIFFVISCILWLISKFREPSLRLLKDRSLMLPLFLFLAFSMLSILWSEYPDRSFRGIFKVLQQVVIFIMVADLFSEPKERLHFERFFLIFFVLLVVDGFFQYTFGKDFIRGFVAQGSMAGRRVSACFKTYTLFGNHLVCVLPFLLALGLRWRNIDRKWNDWYVALPAVVAGVVLLFLTRSRGAILALILGLAAYLIYKKRFAILGFLFVSLVGLIVILPSSMVVHLDGWNKEQSIVERYYLWDRALQVIKAKPLGGTGINTYASAHAHYDQRHNWRVQNYYAHNGYLQMAAEVGLPTLLFFLWFLFNYFRRSILYKRDQATPGQKLVITGLLLGLVNFLIFSAVDTMFHSPQAVMTFWFLLGLQIAYQTEDVNAL